MGAGLSLANRLGAGTAVHGTPDDIPLSPLRLPEEARGRGLEPELHAVTYTWRRMPPGAAAGDLAAGLGAGLAPPHRAPGHTLMLLARRPT